jgi:hypothetical protein
VNVTLIPPDLRGDGLTQYLTAGMNADTAPSPAASLPAAAQKLPPMPSGPAS